MVADRARCTLWELQDAPTYYVERVRAAVIAENGAQETIRKRHARQARRKGMP